MARIARYNFYKASRICSSGRIIGWFKRGPASTTGTQKQHLIVRRRGAVRARKIWASPRQDHQTLGFAASIYYGCLELAKPRRDRMFLYKKRCWPLSNESHHPPGTNTLFYFGLIKLKSSFSYRYSGPTTLILSISLPSAMPMPIEASCVNR